MGSTEHTKFQFLFFVVFCFFVVFVCFLNKYKLKLEFGVFSRTHTWPSPCFSNHVTIYSNVLLLISQVIKVEVIPEKSIVSMGRDPSNTCQVITSIPSFNVNNSARRLLFTRRRSYCLSYHMTSHSFAVGQLRCRSEPNRR